MRHLDFFSGISPLSSHLSDLVLGVDVVEDGEFGSEHVSEVSGFNNSNVPSDKELMMEDHTSHPFVVRPSSHSGERSDGTDIQEEEDKSTSGTAERFVMGRSLLGSNGFNKVSEIVRVNERVRFGVVRVNVSLSHGGDLVRVVSLSV